jgi:hypothetical protein
MSKRNPEEDEFHMWAGYCITAWSKVDARLFEIFWQTLACSKQHAAIIYYRINSLDTRIKLTDELIETVLPKSQHSGGHKHPDAIAWSKIKKSVEDLLRVRSRIAHHPVRENEVSFSIGDDETLNSELIGFPYYESYVSETEALRGKAYEPDTLIATDLEIHQHELKSLAKALLDYRIETLSKHTKALPRPKIRKSQG